MVAHLYMFGDVYSLDGMEGFGYNPFYKTCDSTNTNYMCYFGGTSAAALYYLEKAGFRTAISRAIWAAYERSRELGVDSSAHWPESLPQDQG